MWTASAHVAVAATLLYPTALLIKTIIKDTWTITRGVWKQGREVERAGVMGRGGRKLYLNNNKKRLKKIKKLFYHLKK